MEDERKTRQWTVSAVSPFALHDGRPALVQEKADPVPRSWVEKERPAVSSKDRLSARESAKHTRPF